MRVFFERVQRGDPERKKIALLAPGQPSMGKPI
jgi:hypothetical protein